MANPLAILGALSTVGAQGARGALEGTFEGMEAKKKSESEDAQNRMRALEMLLKQQQLGPQFSVDSQGRIIQSVPGQPPKMIGEMPQTQYGQTRIESMQAQIDRAQAQTAKAEADAAKKESPTAQSILGRIQQKAIEHGIDSLSPVEKALFDRGEKGAKEPTNLDQLIITANDPRKSPEERGRASAEAKAIIAARKDMTTFNVTTRTEAGGKEFDRRTNVREGIRQAQEERKKAFAALTTDQKREAAIGDLHQLREMAKGINEAGLLPPAGTTGWGMWWAQKKRDWMDPSNDSLVAFRGMFGPIMVGEIDRSVYDEKGIRAIQAFKQQFDMVEKMPSYSAISALFNEIETSIRRKQAGGATPSGAASGPPRPAGATASPGVVKWGRDAQGNPVRLP